MRQARVQDYLHRSAERSPDASAVFDGKTDLNYAELQASVKRLALLMKRHGVARGDRVALALGRSSETIVAMMGVLEADAVYVPVDVKAPVERWKAVVADCTPSAVVCDERNSTKLAQVLGDRLGAVLLVVVDSEVHGLAARHVAGPSEWNATDLTPYEPQNGPSDPAYILYTSGSTGAPKGVVISHGNILAYIDWAVDCFDLDEHDAILGTAPFHFDMSVFDIYCSQAAGARFCIANDLLLLFPVKLIDFIEANGVTVWKGVSSLLMYMARAGVLGVGRMPTLRTVLFGGETFATQYLKQWMETYPDKEYGNAYGPTEATGISLFHKVTRIPVDTTERIPIGVPCRGTEAVLMGEDDAVVPRGEVGELCLGGLCLSSGYLNDPDKTASAFIPEWTGGDGPPRRLYRTGDLAYVDSAGIYQFVGRRDDQVKVMGYRVELGEIEHALLSLEPIRDGAVILNEDPGTGLTELVAFVEADAVLDSASILSQIGAMLPQYMVPKRLVQLDRIPRGDRGKVDRRALAEAP